MRHASERGRDPRAPRRRPRGAGPAGPRALLLIPVGLVLTVCVVDVLAPPDVHLGPLLVAAPAITAAFAGPRRTAAIGVLAVAAQVAIGIARGVLGTLNLQAQIGALILVSTLIVVFCLVRDRHERQLTRTRSIAQAAQQVLLRPLPDRSGPLHIASLYIAAEQDADIGGDLFAAARADHSTRLLIGDVRGKGLGAVGQAALLLGAFRAAAHRRATLPDLAFHLDAAMRWDMAQWTAQERAAYEERVEYEERAAYEGRVGQAGRGERGEHEGRAAYGEGAAHGEGAVRRGRLPYAGAEAGPDAGPGGRQHAGEPEEAFATLTLLDIPDHTPFAHAVTCGHPPPLLLRDGRVRPLGATLPALPIGLGSLAAHAGPTGYRVDTFPFEDGDLLLLYTDGVTEARDTAGLFYPLAERVAAWTGEAPHRLLRRLHADLLAHTGGRLGDDAAAIAVRRAPRPTTP